MLCAVITTDKTGYIYALFEYPAVDFSTSYADGSSGNKTADSVACVLRAITNQTSFGRHVG